MQAKHAKQELAVLSAANGALVSLVKNNDIGNQELRDHLASAMAAVISAISAWPEAKTQKDTTWIKNALNRWGKKIKTEQEISMSCLIYITFQSIVDIEERLESYDLWLMKQRDSAFVCQKKDLLKAIYPHVEWCDNFFDEKGRQYAEYERGGAILAELYEIIGFDF